MYIKRFTLVQHTPIIHFQADNEGATLRATEVKPKLDKFLIKKLGKDNLPKEWKRRDEGGKIALDYGLAIQGGEILEDGETIIIPPEKDQWLIAKDIKLKVKTKNTELGKVIELNLSEFFILHNFGKRQSKGFGCFSYNLDSTEKFEEKLRKSSVVGFKSSTKLKYSIQKNDFFYREISNQWHRLKSGKNFNGYEKSRVFRALKDKKLRWDKRFIKRELKTLIDNGSLPKNLSYELEPIDIDCNNRWEDTTQEKYRFGRALLGLAEHYEFRANGGYLYTVKVKGKTVERFKSPMTFKIFRNNIYILLEEIPSELFNQEFSFMVSKKKGKIKEGGDITINRKLRTPSENEFSLETFANQYLQTIGYEPL